MLFNPYIAVYLSAFSLVLNIVNSRYHKVKVHPKQLSSQGKFSGSRKFTLRYQKFEAKGVEIM